MARKELCILALIFVVGASQAQEQTQQPSQPTDLQPTQFDDIVVESSLNIRKKPPTPSPLRARRELVPLDVILFAPQGRLYRPKRQFNQGFSQGNSFGQSFGGPDYGQSSALANAASQNQFAGPGGFGGSAGHAQGQAFNSYGPGGNFGASHAGTQTQGFQVGPGGLSGSAGLSASQAYNLPNGQTLNVALGGTYSQEAGQPGSFGQSNSVGFSG